MGRDAPSSLDPPNHTRRAERASRAMDTINRAIPDMLRASPRARHGIHKAERIVDPPASSTPVKNGAATPPGDARTHIKIRLLCSDTLSAAARLSERPFASKRSAPTQSSQQNPNVAVLNFASPLRPGGGFLDGANSQEEFLCARSTLYPSLWDSFYRLPEVGGLFTPDVLVFRDSTPEANEITKRDRYFVDVISAGMVRFPDARSTGEERSGGACSCGVSYCDRDRELVTHKMRAVLRIAESKGCEKLVLGAWGCGAYGNPASEVAKIWRKVIAGSPRQRRPNSERWRGIKEIVFAVPHRQMLREFERAFEDVLAREPLSPSASRDADLEAEPVAQNQLTNDLISKIAATEMQLDLASNPRAKARLRDVLATLNRDLTRGLANKAAQEEDLTLQEDEEVDDFVLSGFPASDDMEENSFYNFDENDIASESSDGERSEIYEFRSRSRPASGAQGPALHESQDGNTYSFPPSPNFDPQTGWYTGSMDELTRMLRLNSPPKESHSGLDSPMLRPDSSGQEIDEMTISAYLQKYGGTDADDE